MPNKVKKMATQKKRAKQTKESKFSRLYAKKPQIEFVAAILSIPLFISIIVLNFNSIRSLGNAKPTPTPSSMNQPRGFFGEPMGTKKTITENPEATQAPCVKGLGPVSIDSPGEGETVTNNPVEIDISYDDTEHCGAAWSYRINDGAWSGYDNTSVALYNLPKGSVKFELKVKSIVGNDTTSLTRNFIYNGSSSTPNENASNSAQ